jgi:hypothetical protein
MVRLLFYIKFRKEMIFMVMILVFVLFFFFPPIYWRKSKTNKEVKKENYDKRISGMDLYRDPNKMR